MTLSSDKESMSYTDSRPNSNRFTCIRRYIPNAFYIKLAAILIFSMSSHMGLAEPKPGDRLIIRENTTLFSLPGYDYKSYQNSKERFEQLKSVGVTDIIPKRVAWPQEGETVKFIESERLNVNPNNQNIEEEFYLVQYTSAKTPKEGIQGYLHSGLVSLESNDKKDDECSNACSLYNLGAICQSGLFQNILEDLDSFESDFKSSQELEAYFYTYRKGCRDNLHQLYKTQYKHYIQDAAAAFEVPEALLACLLFKENQWDQTTSSTGAVGVAQIMPGTITYASNIIGHINRSPRELQRLQNIVENYTRLASEQLASGRTRPSIPTQMRRDYEYSRTVLYNKNLSDKWKNYIKLLNENASFKKAYPTKPWRGNYPTAFNRERALTPPLAIGVSALYLRDIIEGFKNNFDEESLKNPRQIQDFLVAVSGAYNMGPGNAQRLIRNPPPSSAQEWVKRLETNPETTKHMRSIKRCMQKGNDEPPLMIDNRGRLVDQNPCRSN